MQMALYVQIRVEKHVNESGELKKILMDTKSNTKIEAIKRILFLYNNNNEKDRNDMARTINFIGQNQYNEKPQNALQINMEGEKYDKRVIEISNQIKGILEKLKEGSYDNILDTQSIELENMITNLEYELSYGKSIENTKETFQIKEKLDELEVSLAELKNGNIIERKAKFSNVLTKLSEVCTVIMTTPQLVDIAQNIMVHIKMFLNI